MNPKLAQVTLSKNWMDVEHANFLQIAAVGAVLSRSVSAQQKLRYAFSLFDFNCSESLGENEFSMAFRCIFSGLSLAFEKVQAKVDPAELSSWANSVFQKVGTNLGFKLSEDGRPEILVDTLVKWVFT